jgi:hypothetical protein
MNQENNAEGKNIWDWYFHGTVYQSNDIVEELYL